MPPSLPISPALRLLPWLGTKCEGNAADRRLHHEDRIEGHLMLRRKRDDRAAKLRRDNMEAIVTAYETALLRYATRLTCSADTAQDVVQNAFIKLFRSWDGELETSPRLRAWLYRVTHNEAVDHIRRESRLRRLHEEQASEAEIVTPPVSASQVADAAERRALVTRFIAKLKPREQQVVLLRLEEGLSYREISEVTGRSEGNVGNILHHAVRSLSDHLRRAGVVA